ncbi:MAG TPA: vWA domain-containing protein [Polyangiaceae bacterium]|jgi:hypothetical protein|nr:vWA domain-containing protein [Polyangiaceae bacterium]
MLKYAPLAISVVTLAFLPMACGSSKDSQVNGGDGSNTNTNGMQPNITVGDSDAGNMLSGSHDGGSVALTAAQVTDITQAACTGWSAEGENLPAALMLVIDTSGSMDDPAPGSKNSKWVVTRDALTSAIANLPASVSLGALYFPNEDTGNGTTARDVSACVNTKTMVPMAVLGAAGSMQRTVIDSSLQAIKPQSYTPTADAYDYALKNGLDAYMTSANKFMLLITDGAPTMSLGCINGIADTGGRRGGGGTVMDAPTQPIIDEVASADAMGVKTFVIGSPGSEMSSQGGMDMRPWLSAAARAGGTATPGCVDTGPNFCHLDMTQAPDFSAALNAGLASIAGQVVDSCTFTIPAPPAGQTINPDETNLIVTASDGTSKLILPDNTGTCTEGWQFSGADKIVLCPQSCSEIKGDTGAHVQLVFGCTASQVVPVK